MCGTDCYLTKEGICIFLVVYFFCQVTREAHLITFFFAIQGQRYLDGILDIRFIRQNKNIQTNSRQYNESLIKKNPNIINGLYPDGSGL